MTLCHRPGTSVMFLRRVPGAGTPATGPWSSWNIRVRNPKSVRCGARYHVSASSAPVPNLARLRDRPKKMKLLRTALACLLACVSLTLVKVLVILRRDVQHWKVPLCYGLSCEPRQDLTRAYAAARQFPFLRARHKLVIPSLPLLTQTRTLVITVR